jgi:hypothetical protein
MAFWRLASLAFPLVASVHVTPDSVNQLLRFWATGWRPLVSSLAIGPGSSSSETSCADAPALAPSSSGISGSPHGCRRLHIRRGALRRWIKRCSIGRSRPHTRSKISYRLCSHPLRRRRDSGWLCVLEHSSLCSRQLLISLLDPTNLKDSLEGPDLTFGRVLGREFFVLESPLNPHSFSRAVSSSAVVPLLTTSPERLRH